MTELSREEVIEYYERFCGPREFSPAKVVRMLKALLAAWDALEGLCDKLDTIKEDREYQSVWAIASYHGFTYEGPTWAPEYISAREALPTGKEED